MSSGATHTHAIRRRLRRLWPVALAVCLVPACGDEVVHVVLAHSEAGAPLGDAASSEVTVTTGVDAEVTADAGSSALDLSGAAGADTSDAPAETDADSICATAPSGASVVNVPPDCHAIICDGAGHAAGVVVAQENVPDTGPCLVGTCDALGRAGTAPLLAGTACLRGVGAGLCDGAGSCVECNHTSDCAPGLYCDATHRCGSTPCTDLDCGGACPPCELGKRCLADADCQSFACNVGSARCIEDQCLDHTQDGNETDLDCGGGICKGCELGQTCLLDQDCKSMACDALALKCVSDTCVDFRADAFETDVDCGGGYCAPCPPGKKCKSNLDCMAGHVCNTQKVCQ
jgi:hypothetical protein